MGETSETITQRVAEMQVRPPLKEPDKVILDKMGNYLSGFGNNEAKALTILSFRDTSEILDKYELNRRVRALTGGVWNQHPFASESYCQSSLGKIGLVTREVIDDKQNHYGYMLTRDGLYEGQPMAAFLLLKGYEYSISLYDLFGSTNSFTDSRSPQNSFTLLNALAGSGVPLSRHQLIQTTNINPSTVTVNLKRLSKSGVIQYEAASADDKGYSRYSFRDDTPDDVPKPAFDVGLTKEVWSILKFHAGQPLSLHDIESFVRSTPPLFAKYGHRKRLGTNISNILGALRKQELIDHSQLGVDIRSQASLSEPFKKFIIDVFPKLIKFIGGDVVSIREFGEAKQIVLSESKEGRKIRAIEMARAREKSPSSPLNTKARTEHTAEVREYLQSHGSVRPLKMAQDLELTPANALRALRDLEDDRLVTKNREGRAVYYKLVE